MGIFLFSSVILPLSPHRLKIHTHRIYWHICSWLTFTRPYDRYFNGCSKKASKNSPLPPHRSAILLYGSCLSIWCVLFVVCFGSFVDYKHKFKQTNKQKSGSCQFAKRHHPHQRRGSPNLDVRKVEARKSFAHC